MKSIIKRAFAISSLLMLTAIISVMPASATVPVLDIPEVEIQCGVDGFLQARVTVLVEIEIIDSADLVVYLYPFNDATGQRIGEVSIVIPPQTGQQTYIVTVPLNGRDGGPAANTPDTTGFSTGAELTQVESGDFVNTLGAFFSGEFTYDPPDCDDVSPPPTPSSPATVSLCERSFPILGQILVNQPLDGYGQPGQDRVPNLNVFNDAGNDGFDTFDILDIDMDEDGNPLWYGIFLGGCNPVYVDANLVTRIR